MKHFCTAKTPIPIVGDDAHFVMIEDTYALEVCDICGKKRKCYWLEYLGDRITGIDVCKTCLKTDFIDEVVE